MKLDILSKDINAINVFEVYEALDQINTILDFFSQSENFDSRNSSNKFRENLVLIKNSFSFILINLHKQISFSMLNKKLGMVFINELQNSTNLIFDLIEQEAKDLSLRDFSRFKENFNFLIDYFCGKDNFLEKLKSILLTRNDDFAHGLFNEDLEQEIDDMIFESLEKFLK